MITTLEVIDELYLLLKDSRLFSDAKKPSGALLKGDRPEGSKLEDVVIDAIGGISKAPVQKAVLLVNAYVNNLDPTLIPTIGKGRNMRDSSRLKYLAGLIQQVFGGDGSEEGDLWIGDTCFEVSSDEVFEDEGNDQHYVSFRINCYTIK
ncbi:hypothetical protein ACR788_23805 [Sphingobacterium siyangense]|uniref:hypothetical protein n=1 Tax=Sphingobacterium TaxID=28453 RepID=UPI00191B6A2F|nr:hypothetical protein [Sphingobacterium multivorum]QQT60094.1 hypothetical protein I6I97_12540 [Sphingobacterium multivorum]